MIAERWAATALRVFLVALFGILVMLETLSIPGQYAHMAQQNPDEAYLRRPSTIVSVFWVVCVQVVIVAMWMVWAIAAAWVVLVGVFGWVGINADDPGVLVSFFLFTSGVSVIGLVLVVMRALLQRATTLRSDMEAVI